MMKQLSRLMLAAAFISCSFYSASYPYIYSELVQAVPKSFLSIEQLLACGSTILFCGLWNKFSDKLFPYYWLMLWAEILADFVLFADVLIRHDLKFYFLFNIIIFSVITRNLGCGGVKMRAKVNPTEKDRELFDNNQSIVTSIATIMGASLALIVELPLDILFILALVGNTVDNIFYLYIFHKLKKLSR